MADVMTLTITVRKEVPDRETGRAIFDMVKTRLEDNPSLIVSGHVSNHFDLNDDEPT